MSQIILLIAGFLSLMVAIFFKEGIETALYTIIGLLFYIISKLEDLEVK